MNRLTALFAAIVLVSSVAGCSSSRGDDPSDPVSQLLAKRYIKSTDDFGPHHVSSVLLVEGSGPDGVTTESLYEDLLVDEKSNYRVTRREHDGSTPYELVCIGSSYYVVGPGGKVETLQPGMLGQTTRERVAESWRTVMDPFRSAITLIPVADGTYQGRAVKNFRVEMGKGARNTDGIQPQSLSGTMKVDIETGFPLSVELRGSYVHTPPDKAPVTIQIKKFDFAIDQFGQVPEIADPTRKKKRK